MAATPALRSSKMKSSSTNVVEAGVALVDGYIQRKFSGFKGEDCVEEMFHMMHCVDNCVAPKLWAKLA